MLIATGTPRYVPVFSPRARVHVLWDGELGDFCSLPGEGGAPVLLTFDFAYHLLKWLMSCQEGGLTLSMEEGREAIPCPGPVF